MRVLLATHALLWWLTDNPRLSYTAEAAITNPANDVFVSACVGYEIAYKQRLTGPSARFARKLGPALAAGSDRDFADLARPRAGCRRATRAAPRPWDQIMIAQVLAEQCHVVTIDKAFSNYGLPVVW